MSARAISEDLCDVRGVRLQPGQRVLYCTSGFYRVSALQWGTVVKAYINIDGREYIQLVRDDRKHLVLCSSKRVVVVEQANAPDIEGEEWLRQQLSTLG